MIVLMKALNQEGEQLLRELVKQWSQTGKSLSIVKNIMLNKVSFTMEQENPVLVKYNQPDFAILPKNYKTKRVITATIYSQFKSNGINETNVGVLFE